MKTCFKCRVRKPLTEFYAHHQMADGHLGKCRTCTKKDVQDRYRITRSDRSAYEAKRFSDPDRKQNVARYQLNHRQRHPDRYRARSAVSNAIRDGRLIKLPCHFCGTTVRVQAHHHDYERPLDVSWECFRCHREEEHDQIVVSKWADGEP